MLQSNLTEDTMLQGVIYKSLKFFGFPAYRVGDDGSVWSWKSYHGEWIRLSDRRGSGNHVQVVLCNKGIRKAYTVSGLVLMSFVGPRPLRMGTLHVDGDVGNNALSNLRWSPMGDLQKSRKIPKEEDQVPYRPDPVLGSSVQDSLSREFGDVEVWKGVVGFVGKYEVSNKGRVRSLTRKRPHMGGLYTIKGKILVIQRGSLGYCYAYLGDGVFGKNYTVHFLVLTTFAGPRPDGMQCCHNDGCRHNNHLSNLRWDTPKANQKDRLAHGTSCRGNDSPVSVITEKQAKRIIRLWDKGDRTTTQISDELGIVRHIVKSVCGKKAWGWVRAAGK